MGSPSNKITTCLFFETCAEDAANFYISIFPNSKIESTARFPTSGEGASPQSPGAVMVISFTLNGKSFTALNSKPPSIQMSEAISFMIGCETQEEVDHYWGKLSEGGDEGRQRCGWLQDKFGVSWQVVPKIIPDMMGSGDAQKAAKCMKAFSTMKKINIQEIVDAVEGKA